MDTLTSILSLAFLAQVLRLFTPYYLGASAANFSERGGVINIAVEGFLISSAFSYAVFALSTGSAIAALLLAIVVNLLLALLFSLFTVRLKLNQIVAGVGFNLLIAGIAKFLIIYLYQSSSNTPRFESLPHIPVLSSIPVLGEIAGDYIILFSFALIYVSQFIFYNTKFGLRLRSAGENPEAGDSVGIQVRNYRMYGILLCGFLTALGGVWIASNQSSYSDGMVAGRGYIALAAMIIGKWKPVNIFFACLLFAFFEALQITFQVTGAPVPSQFLQMLPYLITILVLIGFIGKTNPPAADGRPY